MTSWTGLNKPIEKVGLVGCGRMGRCTLQSMLDHGFSVVAYDKFPAAAESAAAMGAEIAASPAELAGRASVILMSLPGPVQLTEVLFGEDGLKKGLTSDHVVIDTSTVDPDRILYDSSRAQVVHFFVTDTYTSSAEHVSVLITADTTSETPPRGVHSKASWITLFILNLFMNSDFLFLSSMITAIRIEGKYWTIKVAI